MLERFLRWLNLQRDLPSRLRDDNASLICVGRDQLTADVIRSVREQGCVLLFGGRQSGKTTLLKRIELCLRRESENGGYTHLPVYVDLMRLKYDASPADFFVMLSGLAGLAWQKRFERSLPAKIGLRADSLEGFEATILHLNSLALDHRICFDFLLDESKRIIGDRFPRGFHDNLFSVLFGASPIQGLCGIVFSGAQDLYKLCEDDTSPIGGRAAKQCLFNLSRDAVLELSSRLLLNCGADVTKIGVEVFEVSGGHAGISAGILRTLASNVGIAARDVVAASVQFRKERAELFQLWFNALSEEAKVCHEMLIRESRLAKTDLIDRLRRAGLSVHRFERVLDEVQYTGIACVEGNYVIGCNRLYIDQALSYFKEETASDVEQSVWRLIRETEIGLRKLVRSSFDRQWPNSADKMIEKALGVQAWQTIVRNREQHEKSYPLSKTAVFEEVLDFVYLGQLGALMTWNDSWSLFRHLFRDKRELEDMLHDITPVRNDAAHFRAVPDKELDRCQVRCRDLLTVIERSNQPS